MEKMMELSPAAMIGNILLRSWSNRNASAS